jgi:Fe-S cluster assembly iron-binding protein IscA
LRTHENGGESLDPWIEVAASSEGAYTYGIYFQAVSDARPDDWTTERGWLTFAVPTNSVDKIRGSVIDIHPDSDRSGKVIENPNRPNGHVGDHCIIAGDCHAEVVRVEEPPDLRGVITKAQSCDSVTLIELMTEPDAYPPVTLWEGYDVQLLGAP